MPPTFRTYEHWSQVLHGALIARANLTTVAPLGAVHTLLQGVALCLDEVSSAASEIQATQDIDRAAGGDLDALAAIILPAGLQRRAAVAATAQLTFSRLAAPAPTTVPAGTKVQDATGQVFNTSADVTLAAGQLSFANVQALAAVPGAAGNLDAHAVSAFAQKPVGIDNVDNPQPTSGGADVEDDDGLRARMRLWVAGLNKGTRAAFIAGLTGLTDPNTGDTILHVGVYRYPNQPGYLEVYVADAAGTNQGRSIALTQAEVLTRNALGPPVGAAQGGETKLAAANLSLDSDAPISVTSSTRGVLSVGTQVVVDFGAGDFYFSPALTQGEVVSTLYSYHTGILALAQKAVNGDPTDFLTTPGIATAEQMVYVRSPALVVVALGLRLTVQDGYDLDTVRDAAKAALLGHLSGLGVGESVVHARLVALAMGVSGVIDVAITEPATDVLLAANQIARPGAVTFG